MEALIRISVEMVQRWEDGLELKLEVLQHLVAYLVMYIDMKGTKVTDTTRRVCYLGIQKIFFHKVSNIIKCC